MQDRQMGLLNNVFQNKLSQYSDTSTTSGVGKEHFDDWAAMTEEQQGYFSALTMSKNIRGAALSFRCRSKDYLEIFTLSISGKSDKYFFEKGKKYKVRLHFGNSIIIYASLQAYKEKHAVITDISDEFLENLFDSESLKIEFHGEGNKIVTAKFSLKGARRAIESSIERCSNSLIT
jgi:hypothetical protein